MALKLVKVNIQVELKVDSSDPEDVRDRLFEYLTIGIDDGDLAFTVEEDEYQEENGDEY
jgi:hypothetical protein